MYNSLLTNPIKKLHEIGQSCWCKPYRTTHFRLLNPESCLLACFSSQTAGVICHLIMSLWLGSGDSRTYSSNSFFTVSIYRSWNSSIVSPSLANTGFPKTRRRSLCMKLHKLKRHQLWWKHDYIRHLFRFYILVGNSDFSNRGFRNGSRQETYDEACHLPWNLLVELPLHTPNPKIFHGCKTSHRMSNIDLKVWTSDDAIINRDDTIRFFILKN